MCPFMNCILFTVIVFNLFLFIYLFKSDHQWVHNTYNQNSEQTHTNHKIRKTQKRTHYDEIVNYSDAEQLITCTRLFGQENSLLANVTFALCITVLQLGSPNSISMAQTLLYL